MVRVVQHGLTKTGELKWFRVKLSKHFYLNIRFLRFIPIIWVAYDKRLIDDFFNYLIEDAMWD